MIIKANHLIIIFCMLFLVACKKDDPTISKVPSIEFVDLIPTQVIEFQDELVFTISYIDGDGDLGENDPDVSNLFIKDSRNSVEYKFRIPQLAPDGSEISIQGELSITLKNTAITNNSTSQQVSYTMYVVDRAGNKSEEVESFGITVLAQ